MPARLSSLVRLTGSARSDRELLRAHLDDGDPAAMDELIRRYSKLARRVAAEVCPSAADDVVQASLALLHQKVAGIADRESAAGWVFETARRLALKARAGIARRARHEGRAKPPQSPADPLDTITLREVRAAVAEELTRLPEELRLPLVLCYWDGANRTAAAARLGCSVSTLKRRLNDGRDRLAARLARRGFAGPAVLAALTAVQAGADAAVPAGASGSREFVRWKVVSSIVVAVGIAALGIGFGIYSPVAADPPTKSDAPPATARPGPVGEGGADRLPDGAVARLGYSPHSLGGSAFALTPDEKEIVTLSPEGIVRRFDAKSGELRGRKQLTSPTGDWLGTHGTPGLSADGATAALYVPVASGLRLSIWDVGTAKELLQVEPEAPARTGGFALSPDGKTLAVTEYVKGAAIVRAIDIATGKGKKLGDLERNVYDPRFSADGKRLVLQHTSGRGEEPGRYLSCFDVPTGSQVWKLPANCDKFAVSSDGRLVMFAQYDRPGFRIIETDLRTGRTTQYEQPHAGGTAHVNVPVAFAPDSRTLLVGHMDGLISWDIQDAKEMRRLAFAANGIIGYGQELGAFSADGKTVITNRGLLQRWDLSTGKPVFETVMSDSLHTPISHLAFTPDGKDLFASGWSSNAGRWNLATGKQVSAHRKGFGKEFVTTPDGLRSVGADDYYSPHEMVLYDPVAGTELKKLRWTAEGAIGRNDHKTYALATDGRTLLIHHDDSRTEMRTTRVIVHDVVTDRQLSRFTVRATRYYQSSRFSPCGRWLGFEGKVYHTRSGTELFAPAVADRDGQTTAALHPGGPIWFSSDGRLLAGKILEKGSDKADALGVWELASGRLLSRVADSRWVAQVAFSPDGRAIAVVNGRGAFVHDLLTGRRLAEFLSPNITCPYSNLDAGTQSVAFSLDGRLLATGHRDGSVLLWTVPRPPAPDSADLWLAFGSSSPVEARTAVDRVVRDSAAYKLVAAHLRPPAEEANPQIASLIADLDSATYATRETASKKLRALGGTAEPAMRQALAAAPSPEARRRLDDLLAAIPAAVQTLPVSGETLRGIRVVEILERLGTPEARDMLQAWANQGRDPRVAAEARLVLVRTGAPATRSPLD